MTYAAIFDFRFNHIPLSKRHGFLYHARDEYCASTYDTVFTHKADWVTQGTFYLSGAPGDVSIYQGNLNGSVMTAFPKTTAEATNTNPGRKLKAGLDGAISDSSNNETQVGIADTSSQVDGHQTSSDSFHGDPGVGYSTSLFRYGGRLPDIESGLHSGLVNPSHPIDGFGGAS